MMLTILVHFTMDTWKYIDLVTNISLITSSHQYLCGSVIYTKRNEKKKQIEYLQGNFRVCVNYFYITKSWSNKSPMVNFWQVLFNEFNQMKSIKHKTHTTTTTTPTKHSLSLVNIRKKAPQRILINKRRLKNRNEKKLKK